MRKPMLLAILSGTMLVGSLSAQIPAGTTSVSFVDFCDGATITYSGTGSFIVGTHDNFDCAGDQTFIGGVSAQGLKFAPGEGTAPALVANMADNVGVLGLSNGALQLYLDFTKDTFSFYEETDSAHPEALVNQGKFKIVNSPVSSGSGVAAWQGPVTPTNPAPNPGPAYPSGTYDVYFDGYCDYLHLTTNGNRVGGVHDLATYCGIPNAPVAANDASLAADVDGTAGASLVTTDNELNIDYGDDCVVNFYLDFAASTWSLYAACDSSGLFFLNSGTFTFVQNGPYAPVQRPSRVGLPPTIMRR